MQRKTTSQTTSTFGVPGQIDCHREAVFVSGSIVQFRSWAGPQRESEVKASTTATGALSSTNVRKKISVMQAMPNNCADGEGPSVFGF